MKSQLLEKGLGDSVLDVGDGRLIEGEEMVQLCRILAGMEDALVVLERRGISLRNHAARIDPATSRMPVYHVLVGRQLKWVHTRRQLDELISQQEREIGGEVTIHDSKAPT